MILILEDPTVMEKIYLISLGVRMEVLVTLCVKNSYSHRVE